MNNSPSFAQFDVHSQDFADTGYLGATIAELTGVEFELEKFIEEIWYRALGIIGDDSKRFFQLVEMLLDRKTLTCSEIRTFLGVAE